MTNEEYLRALTELEQRLHRVSGKAARHLNEHIADSRSAGATDSALSPLLHQFQLVELSHRVSRAECESSHIVASDWANSATPRVRSG